MIKQKKLDLNGYSICDNAKHFDDGLQIYLVFQPRFKFFRIPVGSGTVTAWNSKGLSC